MHTFLFVYSVSKLKKNQKTPNRRVHLMHLGTTLKRVSFMCASCLIWTATSNKTTSAHDVNGISKHFHFSFRLNLSPPTQAIIRTCWLHWAVFKMLCPLLITCWWLALDAFRFIINSPDGGIYMRSTTQWILTYYRGPQDHVKIRPMMGVGGKKNQFRVWEF